MEDIFKDGSGRGRPAIHPFAGMQVGEIVTITDNVSKMQVYVHVYGRSSGKKFQTRTRESSLYVKRVS